MHAISETKLSPGSLAGHPYRVGYVLACAAVVLSAACRNPPRTYACTTACHHEPIAAGSTTASAGSSQRDALRHDLQEGAGWNAAASGCEAGQH